MGTLNGDIHVHPQINSPYNKHRPYDYMFRNLMSEIEHEIYNFNVSADNTIYEFSHQSNVKWFVIMIWELTHLVIWEFTSD